VAVKVEGYSDLAMSEPFARDLGMDAVSKQMGSVCVAEIVEPQMQLYWNECSPTSTGCVPSGTS
jgi:hypothetical protein